MKKFTSKKPVLFSIVALVLFMAVLFLFSKVLDALPIQDEMVLNLLGEVVLLLVPCAFLMLSGKCYVLRDTARGFFCGLRSGLYFLIMSLYTFCMYLFLVCAWDVLVRFGIADGYRMLGYDFAGYSLQPAGHILAFLLFVTLVGVAEELMFRGIIADSMIRRFGSTPKGVVGASFLSGALFGGMHLINAFGTGLLSASIQALVAAVIGTAFNAIYYKHKSLWALVFIHAFNDFATLAVLGGGLFCGPDGGNDIVSAMSYGLSNLVALVPYAVMLPILLRRSNIRRIMENYGFPTQKPKTELQVLQ